jgi:hypothetical protein
MAYDIGLEFNKQKSGNAGPGTNRVHPKKEQ